MLNRKFFDCLTMPGVYGAMGKPRAGKTTVTAAIAAENHRRLVKCQKLKTEKARERYRARHPFFDRVYCTDPSVQNTITIDYAQLGTWNVADYSLILLEEAGIGLDNRNWKAMPAHIKRIIAMIGHKKSTIFYSSQTADIDKVLRVRSAQMWMIARWYGNISLVRPITYEFGVDNETGDLKDVYHTPQGFREVLVSFLRRETFLFNRRPYYKFFDSWIDDYEYKKPDPWDVAHGLVPSKSSDSASG